MLAVKELGGLTEEILSALKLVVSFNRENLACEDFNKIAFETRDRAKKSAYAMAGMMGFFMGTMFGFFCYSYYIGSILIEKKYKEPGNSKPMDILVIVTTSQAMLMAMMTLAGLVPIIPGVFKALMSAQQVFDLIERVPLIKN
jgi:ABC-type multidrug transport system fused ATPase/permease subunit